MAKFVICLLCARSFTADGACCAHHVDDYFVERVNHPNDLATALIMTQERQSNSKEHREEYDAQDIHVCSCCNDVVGYEISQELQEGICSRFWLCWLVCKLPESNL